jgi:hypothetical protein
MLVFGGQTGEPSQRFIDSTVDRTQQGQRLVPQPIAGVVLLPVRGVLPVGPTPIGREALELVSAHGEEGPKVWWVPFRHSGHTPQSRSSDETKEDRFHLVVGVMAQGNGIERPARPDLLEEHLPLPARLGLEARSPAEGLRLEPVRVEREPELSRELAAECGVGFGARPKSVVHVGHLEVPPVHLAHGGKETEQADRVCAPGHRHEEIPAQQPGAVQDFSNMAD